MILLLEAVIDIMTILKLLGHESIDTTIIYLHVVQPVDRPPLSVLDQLVTILNLHWERANEQLSLNGWQWRILHTWRQTLTLHPHLHCIIPGDGITSTGDWKSTRCKGKFLYPVKGVSAVFRARYIAGSRKAFPEQAAEFFNQLFATPWVVYAKRPFGGPDQVIE